MKITINPTFDIETWTLESHDGQFDYFGPVELVKGGASKNEMNRANAAQDAQNAMQKQAWGLQQQNLGAMNSVLDPMIAAGGLAPGVENAMTSQVMNNIPAQFQGVQGNINNQLVARGITGGQAGAGGGDVARQFGQLGAMQAGMQQQGLGNIQLAKQGALMNDLALKGGIAGQYGGAAGMFGQGASNALSGGITAANNVDQAQTGLWGSLIGAAGSLGGGAIAGKKW